MPTGGGGEEPEIVVPAPQRRRQAGDGLEERQVDLLGDGLVADGDELVGDVAHEQGHAPAVAAPGRRAERGVVDQAGDRIHQAGRPHPPRPAADVARDPHREVRLGCTYFTTQRSPSTSTCSNAAPDRASSGRWSPAPGPGEQLLDGIGHGSGVQRGERVHHGREHARIVAEVPCNALAAATADLLHGVAQMVGLSEHLTSGGQNDERHPGSERQPGSDRGDRGLHRPLRTDLGAVLHGATVVVGDKLGLYRALAASGPSTPEELAAATGCDARYVREWLSAQAAAEYAHYDPSTGRFHLDAAQAACLADESLPTFLGRGHGGGVVTAPRRGRRARCLPDG